jgi:hypothetical protein
LWPRLHPQVAVLSVHRLFGGHLPRGKLPLPACENAMRAGRRYEGLCGPQDEQRQLWPLWPELPGHEHLRRQWDAGRLRLHPRLHGQDLWHQRLWWLLWNVHLSLYLLRRHLRECIDRRYPLW